MKRLILTAALAVIALLPMLATPQISNSLKIDGKKWGMNFQPEDEALRNAIRAQIPDIHVISCCWNGYTTSWSITDGMLTLDSVSVIFTNSNNDIDFYPMPQKDIDAAFHSIGRKNRVATWVNKTINVTKGKYFSFTEDNVCYRHSATEMSLEIKNGKVVGQQEIHNRKVIEGFSLQNFQDARMKFQDTIHKYIKIKADDYPELKKRFSIHIEEGDSLGRITKINIHKLQDMDIDENRKNQITDYVLKALNEAGPWTTYYINGKYVLYDRGWTFPYRFE